MPRKSGTQVTFAALAAVLVMGVPGGAVRADTFDVKGEITTAEDLNPDYRGRPSPIVLQIFQLTAAETFRNADFFSLYDPEGAVLGGDLIARTQMMLQPGQTATPFEAEFDENARFVGFVAAFRDIENAEWRALIELPERGFFRNFFSRSRFMIELESLALSVTVE